MIRGRDAKRVKAETPFDGKLLSLHKHLNEWYNTQENIQPCHVQRLRIIGTDELGISGRAMPTQRAFTMGNPALRAKARKLTCAAHD
jgi:hypothetical protein